MTAPTVKKGRKPLASSDLCPRAPCGTTLGHLMSDHADERARQCSRCACVTQDVHAQQANDLTMS